MTSSLNNHITFVYYEKNVTSLQTIQETVLALLFSCQNAFVDMYVVSVYAYIP